MAVLALVAGAGFFGYQRGGADCRSEYQARELEEIRKSNELDEARRKAERERDELARNLEEEINASPVVINRCIGPDRGVQLNRLRPVR